jgi:hypothetical protein
MNGLQSRGSPDIRQAARARAKLRERFPILLQAEDMPAGSGWW